MNKFDVAKILVVLTVFGVSVLLGYQIMNPGPKLPVYNPSDLNPDLVDDEVERKGRNHAISDFSLTDQNGKERTVADLRNHIYVADFFFTTCPTICIDMSKNMEVLQKEFADDKEFLLVSHTVMPEVDSVPVLKAYAELHEANDDQWIFLTGPKSEIYRLARRDYFAVLDNDALGEEHDFIHTENFILVDWNGRIRGFYDGTNDESIQKLISDVKILKKEKE
ncbi:MAG: SCO family protein [Schleiferiaceae bacterium]